MKETKFKQTEVGMIPSDWKETYLGNIGPVKMCKRVMKYQTSEKGDIPFYKIGTFGKSPDAYISKDLYHYLKNKYSFPQKGTILISAAGTIGRTVVYDGKDAFFQDSNIVWLENDESILTNQYLYYLYQVVEWKTENGGAVSRLYNDNFKITPIAIPSSKEEQQRIAKALSDVDTLINNLEKLIAKKKNIKQGAMQQLLTGRKRLPGFAPAKPTYKQTELGKIPTDWEFEVFGKLVSIYRGGSPRPIEAYITTNPSGINWIKIGDVEEGAKYITSTQERIIPEGKSKSREVHKGEFILSNSMSFGRPYILKVDGCIHDGWLTIQDYQDTFDTDFLYYALSSEVVFNQYVSMAAGSSVQNLNKEKVAAVKLFYPSSKEEQTAIANVLSDMDSEIATLETKLAKYRKLKTGMMQQLLTGKIRLV